MAKMNIKKGDKVKVLTGKDRGAEGTVLATKPSSQRVTVEKVNIINVKPKTKRVGRYVGKTKAIRKAIVKIKAGQEIDLFGEKNEK